MTAYLPPVWTRLWELLHAILHVLFPPTVEFQPGDCLIVCDAIVAYQSLFSDTAVTAVRRVVRDATRAGIPVVYTQWVRVRPPTDEGDAVDVKGHWSEYIPDITQSRILPTVTNGPTPTLVADVRFPNAFVRDSVAELCGSAKRVVLAGAWTESCILATSRGALERNLKPVVVKNACVGHAPASWLALICIQLFCGEIVST